MKLSIKAVALGVLVSLASGMGYADAVKPEDAIKYRQSVMTAIKWQFGPLGAMVKGARPYDKDLFIRNAAYLEVLAKMPLEGFVPGSDKGDTKAKPEIWSEMDKFKGGMEKLQVESAKLAQLATTGNMDEIKAQFGETAKTCKACHDNFKAK
jgi:cytochrome c556